MDKIKLLLDLIFQCETRKKARAERIEAMNRRRHSIRKKIRLDVAERKKIIDQLSAMDDLMHYNRNKFPYNHPAVRGYHGKYAKDRPSKAPNTKS
jgi:hypothetical protein